MAIKFDRIDYTGRDFDVIRASCIAYLQQFVPEMTDHNESDLGIVLIDLFSYVHDGLHFYLDNRINEAFLPTALELESVIKLLKTIDYNITNYIPASVEITFNLVQPITNDIVIPKGHRVGTSDLTNNYIFNLVEDLTIPAGSVDGVGIYNEGIYFNETLGTSDGITPNQEYDLTYTDWLEDSLKIYTEDNLGNKIYYRRLGKNDDIPSFVFADANDKVFDVKIEEFKTTIIFGDGIHGYIPDNGLDIKAEYYRGHGYKANVSAKSLTVILDPITDVLGNAVPIYCTNVFPATGGKSRETIEEAKVNGPASLRTMYRAVTAEDFKTIAKSFRDPVYGGISDAMAVPDFTYYSDAINLYVVAEDNNQYPVNAGTPLKNALKDYIDDRRVIGMEVNILDPTFLTVDITADIYIYDNFKQSDILAKANELIDEMFKVYNMSFGGDNGKIALSDLYTILNSINGVNYVYITNPTANIDVNSNEFPVKGTITLNIHGGA